MNSGGSDSGCCGVKKELGGGASSNMDGRSAIFGGLGCMEIFR